MKHMYFWCMFLDPYLTTCTTYFTYKCPDYCYVESTHVYLISNCHPGQVSHLVSTIFKCNTSTASQTCTLSLDDTYTSFKIMGVIFGVVTVGIVLYSITVVNNLVNLLWTMDLFAPVYCNPFRNRPFRTKRYQILCDCRAWPPPAATTAPQGGNSGSYKCNLFSSLNAAFFFLKSHALGVTQ